MHQSKRLPLLPAIATLALLAGCGDEPEAVEDDEERSASGEVLEGSISDAMLPLDQLRSQPPLAEIQPDNGGAPAADEQPDAPPEDGDEANPPPVDPPAAPPVTLDLPPPETGDE